VEVAFGADERLEDCGVIMHRRPGVDGIGEGGGQNDSRHGRQPGDRRSCKVGGLAARQLDGAGDVILQRDDEGSVGDRVSVTVREDSVGLADDSALAFWL
jgi:hypothetical protein